MTELKTTVVIAADKVQGAPWRAELDAATDIDVIGESNVAAGLAQQVIDLLPDVVLASMDLPALDITGLCAELAATVPVSRVVVVSGQRDAPYAAVAAGAAGAVSADALVGHVATVVRRTARGEGLVTQKWADMLLQSDVSPRLTATEREVLQRVANGAPIEAVAGLHEVPPRLVHLHAGYALAKVHRAAEDERLANGRT
jgi:DNA-binding NarL/FixJ family response regulator